MPDIGAMHPQIVHFVIAPLVLGVVLRLVTLTGRAKALGPAATLLLVFGALASVVAVKSGDDAHGPAERIPGARTIVEEHEEWGERTRNVFLAVAAVELIALAVPGSRVAKGLLVASGVAGLGGLFAVYEAGEHGGEIVYSYAGGVGIRSGDPADVGRLVKAGLFQQTLQDREAGRGAAAEETARELASRFPDDLEIQLFHVESLIVDAGDPRGALDRLAAIPVPAGSPGVAYRAGLLRADAWVALEQPDSARAVLVRLRDEIGPRGGIESRLEALEGRE